MECTWLLLALIFAVAVAFISKTSLRRPDRNLPIPPGPKPWPIIGNLNLLGSVPHQSLHHLSQKYGGIMLLKFGKFPVVVASSPEMARQFLKVHDAVFASRPAFAAHKYISYNYSDIGFSPYGAYWRGLRKLLISEFLNPKNIKSLEQIRIEEGREFLSRLRSQSADEKPVVIRDHLSCLTLSIICRMVLTDKYFSGSGEGKSSSVDMDELLEILSEWFQLSGAFNIGDWIPWLGFLDLQGNVKKAKGLRRKMDRFTDYVIDDHLAKRVEGKCNGDTDFLDILLQIAEDSNIEVKLTKDGVRGVILNVLEGGTDTSATTVEWAMHEIMKQPRIIEKAKEELDRVIGRNRWVEESDLIQLPYIDAIIMETFRLHPPCTMLAPHYSTQDCIVAGYHIPKGTTVLINVWSIGRDPSSWEAAEKFLPERFVAKEIELIGSNNFVLLPFGSGRRRCPGYNLGLRIVRTTLANLLHGFDVKLEEGMRAEDICMDENYGLNTSPKHPLSIIMKRALPDYLYS